MLMLYKTGKYDSWLRHANEREVMADVFRRRKREWLHTHPIGIIDVGSGTGAAANKLFAILDDDRIPFTYTGLEPVEEMIDQFPLRRETRIIQTTLEAYTPVGRVDLVTAIHSLYYMTDLRSALDKLATMGDRMLIVHHGKRGIHQVQERFPDAVERGDNNIFSTHNDITDLLDDMGIEYAFENYETMVNIRPCKREGDIHGQNLITFFLEQENLCPQDEVRVRAYLRTLPDELIHDMGVIITCRK